METPLEHLIKPSNIAAISGKKRLGMSHQCAWLSWFDEQKTQEESP